MKQAGNALFLILIAVALFAALSYAVTQSGRGGGSIDRETSLLEASQIVQAVEQFTNDVKRFSILSGISPTDLTFCDTVTTVCNLDGPAGGDQCTTGSTCVFAPEGGGIEIDPILKSKFGLNVSWEFQTDFDGNGTGASDMALYINQFPGTAGITSGICREINNGFGLGSVILPANEPGPGQNDSAPGEADFCQFNSFQSRHFYIKVLYPF